jgi:iron complex outermembrane recepter protein
MKKYVQRSSSIRISPTIPSFLLSLVLAAGSVITSQSTLVGQSPAAEIPTGGRGTVTGYVSNELTGQLLQDATIKVEGTSITTTSERGGAFSISLPSGSHTLTVRYAGLSTMSVPVTVTGGQTTIQNIGLTSDIYKMEPYTVTGLREGQASAIQQQRLADNLKTVVSTDAFGNPASNPGELLQRLPGVSVELQGGEVRNFLIRGFTSDFTTMMIDGNPMASSEGSVNTRQVNIAQISTDNLESVELIKAPTPDMDANAIGGYINVRTKRAFDRRGRLITLSAGTRWTNFKTSDIRGKDKPELDQYSFGFSDTYSILGGTNNLGVSFTHGYRSSPLLLDEVGTFSGLSILNYYLLPTAANGLTTPVQRQFGTGMLFYPDTRNLNFGLNIDFKLSRDTYVYVKNTYNDLSNRSQESGLTRFTLSSLTATTSANFAPGSNAQTSEVLPIGNSVATLTSQFQQKTLKAYAISTGFEHKLRAINSRLNVDLSYSIARSGYPINSSITANMTDRIGWKVDRSAGTDEFRPGFTQTAGPSIYDPANYTPTTAFRQVYKIPNELMGVRADFQKNFTLLNAPTYVKVGGKFSQNERKYQNSPEYWTYIGPKGVGPFLAPATKSGDNLYGPFPMIQGPFSGLQGDPFTNASLWTKSALDAYNTAFYSGGAWNSSITEKISAVYMMGAIQFKKVRIVPGARVEFTDSTARGHLKNQSVAWGGNYVATLSPQENAERALHSILPKREWNSNYVNVFPGLHFIYEPFEKLLIRASYNKSITRPPVLSLIPQGISINEETQTITAANPDLKPYTSDNFEFAIQKYFEPVGSFEIGVFRKDIKNYIRTVQTFVPAGADNGYDGQYVGYKLNRAFNVGGARYRGFEFNYQQQFSFLPGVWRGFGTSANFTYTQAEGSFGGTGYLKTLANVRPRFGNVALSYIGHGLDIRVLGNYQGRVYKSGAGATTLWGDSQTMIDLKTQYRINRRYQLYFEISNLLDENVSTFIQEGDLPIYSQKQGMLFAAGVKATF